MNIQKATWANGHSKMSLAFPFAKVDKENRTVSGFATLDNIDHHGDIVTSEASKKAFERFRGNIREMHQPIAVGKILSFNEEDYYDAEAGKNYKGVFVQAYISKGAQDTWEKVLDGTLTGFSIGGNIVEAGMQPGDSSADEERRVIKEYDLQELSLVDNPANPLANVFSIQKSGDNLIFKGMATEIETENVFWCGTDQIATANTNETKECSICGDSMQTIGWIEKFDEEKSESIQKVVDGYLKKDDAPGPNHGPNGTLDSPSAPINSKTTINLYPDQIGNNISVTKASMGVGSFVSWGSSGGKAYGRILSIKEKGKINVPNSSFEISATPENPAASIRVYEKTDDGWKPTDTIVGHKINTLKPAKTVKKKISKGGSIVAQESPEELEYDQAEEINEVVEETEEAVIEKAVEVSEVEVDELDFTKMVTDLKDFVGVKLEKSIEDTKTYSNSLSKALETEHSDLVKRFEADKVEKEELRKSVDDLTKLVTELQKSLTDTAGRVTMYENDTAFKKSGDMDKPEVARQENNIWQGHFLGVQDL